MIDDNSKREFANLAKEVLSIKAKLHTGPFGVSSYIQIELVADGETVSTVYVDLPDKD